MKKSKTENQANPSESQRRNRKGWQAHYEEEGFSRHEKKKSGKRFHRRKTLKDDLWDSLTDED